MKVCTWADGTWCYNYEVDIVMLESGKSDDYEESESWDLDPGFYIGDEYD